MVVDVVVDVGEADGVGIGEVGGGDGGVVVVVVDDGELICLVTKVQEANMRLGT